MGGGWGWVGGWGGGGGVVKGKYFNEVLDPVLVRHLRVARGKGGQRQFKCVASQGPLKSLGAHFNAVLDLMQCLILYLSAICPAGEEG